MRLLTYIHDPDNLYIPLLENLIIPDEISPITIAISPSTTSDVRKMIDKFPFKQILGGTYGTARLNLIKDALLDTDEQHFFVCDFDKLIHWINTNQSEFIDTYKRVPNTDLTVVGRSARAYVSYPQTWVNTEAIATKVLSKIIKSNVDFMNGPHILNRKVAEAIAEQAVEQGIGSCVEFCLVAYKNNLSISNVDVDGLTWEDPDRYKALIEKEPTYEDWKYITYDSLYEWRKRVKFLDAQVEVMIRYSEEPTNPKYPLVHNKNIELPE